MSEATSVTGNDDDDQNHTLEEKQTMFAHCCLGLCKPFVNISDLLDGCESWLLAYHTFLNSGNSTVPLANRLLENSQEYYIGKADGRREQAERAASAGEQVQFDGDELDETVQENEADNAATAEFAIPATVFQLNLANNEFSSTFRLPAFHEELKMISTDYRETNWKDACRHGIIVDEGHDEDILTIRARAGNARERFDLKNFLTHLFCIPRRRYWLLPYRRYQICPQFQKQFKLCF